jgi:aminopeptidase YwaD
VEDISVIRDCVSLIRKAYSGEVAKGDVGEIVRHHRIQASPGYRAAAEYVFEQLQRAGLDARLEFFPADSTTTFWTASSFQEWDAAGAILHLAEPSDQARKLADYREQKISLIQRSAPYDGTAEVVLLEDGLEESEYQGLQLTGKVVLTKGDVEPVRRLAVDQHGAIGILFYGMRTVRPVREPMDVPDVRQYTSFWWSGCPGEKQCFGFVLTPRQGKWLSELVRQRARSGQSAVQVRARVDSRSYDGALEVVSALIPGESDEEIVVVSHLCHPQPSANDNASGAAASLEAARTLQRLVEAGELPRPRRGIRFLWVPEMTGTFAYLSHHEEMIARMIAGVNLDMVGGDQCLNGSALLLERPPDSASSFVPDLLERLREELSNDGTSHTGLGVIPLFRYATTGFSGGSDHYIFSDPTVGVPMAMLIQWPDKFYHTSADTLEKIDPAMLARAGCLAAAFAFLAANAGESEVTWLAFEVAARFRERLARQIQVRLTQMWDGAVPATMDDLERRASYELERHRESLDSLSRLWDGAGQVVVELQAEAADYIAAYLRSIRKAVQACEDRLASAGGARNEDEWEQEAAGMVPRRRYRGPADLRGHWVKVAPAERAAWFSLMKSRPDGGWTLPVLADYWADGRRTVRDIVDLVEMESGIRDAELIVKRFELLHKLGLVDLHRVGDA